MNVAHHFIGAGVPFMYLLRNINMRSLDRFSASERGTPSKIKLFGETDYEITFFKTFINKLSQKNSSIDLLNGEEKKVLIASNVVDLQHHNVVETTDIFKAFAAYFCSFSTLLPQLHGRYQLINLAQLWACWRLIASRRDNKK